MCEQLLPEQFKHMRQHSKLECLHLHQHQLLLMQIHFGIGKVLLSQNLLSLTGIGLFSWKSSSFSRRLKSQHHRERWNYSFYPLWENEPLTRWSENHLYWRDYHFQKIQSRHSSTHKWDDESQWWGHLSEQDYCGRFPALCTAQKSWKLIRAMSCLLNRQHFPIMM